MDQSYLKVHFGISYCQFVLEKCQKISNFIGSTALHNFTICAPWKVPAKCFKICDTYDMRKFTVFFLVEKTRSFLIPKNGKFWRISKSCSLLEKNYPCHSAEEFQKCAYSEIVRSPKSIYNPCTNTFVSSIDLLCTRRILITS